MGDLVQRATCLECGGDGWVYDMLGGCGDPACCGGPYKVQCRQCDNDWTPDAAPDTGKALGAGE